MAMECSNGTYLLEIRKKSQCIDCLECVATAILSSENFSFIKVKIPVLE